MCGDIHEADTDTAEDEKSAKSDNLHTPDWFVNYLRRVKENNIEFWKSQKGKTIR